MAIRPQVSSGTKRSRMDAGQHPAVLASVFAKTKEFQGKPREVFVWRFDHKSELDEEGNPLCVYCETGQFFGDDRAHLTKLLRQVFGPDLTKEQVEQMDFERMVNRIEGYVLVQNWAKDGKTGVEWGSYLHPKRREYPNPEDFFAGEETDDFEEQEPPQSYQAQAPAPPTRSARPTPAAPVARTATTAAPAARHAPRGNHIPGVGPSRGGGAVASMQARRPAPQPAEYDDLDDPFAD